MEEEIEEDSDKADSLEEEGGKHEIGDGEYNGE